MTEQDPDNHVVGDALFTLDKKRALILWPLLTLSAVALLSSANFIIKGKPITLEDISTLLPVSKIIKYLAVGEFAWFFGSFFWAVHKDMFDYDHYIDHLHPFGSAFNLIRNGANQLQARIRSGYKQ
jgi:hypothetical protein